MLQINIDETSVSRAELEEYKSILKEKNKELYERTGKGNDYLGWLELPSYISNYLLSEIEKTAARLRQSSEIIIVIGIGGSYLGARAVIDALSHSFNNLVPAAPLVLFAGQNISEDYLSDLLGILNKKSYSLIVISKSGTTTEPAIAFRVLKAHLENKFGKKEAAQRIAAVTDGSKGALKKLADTEGYKTFVIPDDVGGRYSVLTPVGLLPVACAGFDIRKLVKGAREMQEFTAMEKELLKNPADLYAAVRNILYKKGKVIEILAAYEPKLQYLIEWWKQLYGESEGKEGKGIFPAGVNLTTDLHSMGQMIQDGVRNIFETVISIQSPSARLRLPEDKQNLDELNYIANKRLSEINHKAELGTRMAHVEGGVPNILISVPSLNEEYIGQLIYFFEKACALSGYILGVNPFDQPGVEAYKKNMFKLLGKL